MLISLSMTAAQLNRADASMLREACTELLVAHRNGHHLLVLNREQSLWIIENLGFSGVLGATLQSVRADFTQTATLVERATSYIAVVESGRSPSMQRTGSAIEIGIDQISRPYLLNRTAIIFEDLVTDARLFALVLRRIAIRRRLPRLNWEAFHGGGARVPEVWKQLISEWRIACAVVDCDHVHPRATASSKVAQLQAIAAGNCWPLAFAHSPNCREAENLIPLSIIEQLQCAVGHTDNIAKLRDIAAAEKRESVDNRECCWWYVDLKNGIKIDGLSTQEGSWYRTKASLVGMSLENWVWSGFGSAIVTQVLNDGRLCGELGRAVCDSAYEEILGPEFDDLAWHCAAPAPKIT